MRGFLIVSIHGLMVVWCDGAIDVYMTKGGRGHERASEW